MLYTFVHTSDACHQCQQQIGATNLPIKTTTAAAAELLHDKWGIVVAGML